MKPILEWTVQPEDGQRVRDIIAHMRDLGAPDDGRIYVNSRRAELDDVVEAGDRVEVYPRRDAADPSLTSILAQRDGIILAHKPAGMPTETTRLGEDSLLSALMTSLSGGQVRAATRLDVQVSGIVVCTLGHDAQRRVEKWRRAGQLKRTYRAIGHGVLVADAGVWDWPLAIRPDRGGRHRVVTQAGEGRPARTRFSVLRRAGGAIPDASSVMLELIPETGRMHQLRAHASRAGVPLLGDRVYGGPRQLVAASGAVTSIRRIALHAAVVELPTLRAESAFPEELEELWERVFAAGGRC